MDFKSKICQIILDILKSEKIGYDFDELYSTIEIPPNSNLGDYALPCYKFAKILKKSPQIISSDFYDKINNLDNLDNLDNLNYLLEKIQVEGAYLNFFVNKKTFANSTINDILLNKNCYNIGQNKTIVIDYSSPNIAKPFHVGHMRSTFIGNALYNIFKELGYNVIGINHLGDWGTQFGKLIVAYNMWGCKEDVESKGIDELNRLYVKFHQNQTPDLENQARSWMLKMQNNDETAINLWKWFNQISLDEFNKIYEKLNIEFDFFTGESFYNDKMDEIVKMLHQKNLLINSDGAQVVDLEKFDMPPCLILRKDGGTLYPTRDISAAFFRKKEYNFHKCIYVTAIDQILHFSQWFKVVELMDMPWACDLVHIPFGLVSFSGAKLSTRKGNVVLMKDLIEEALQKTLSIIENKNPDLENKSQVAQQIAIGALIFNDLFNTRSKEVSFSFDKILNFDGETGPYVQYTYARTCSILNKSQNIDFENIDFDYALDEYSFNLLKVISSYKDKVLESSVKFEPYIISRYLIELSQNFNKFYHETKNILMLDPEIKNTKLALIYCTNITLKQGLKLLGISAPQKI